jgi:hypothetical protein
MREDVPVLQSELQQKAEKDKREYNVLEKTKEYLEKNLQDAEV